MRVGGPSEVKNHEYRVAATPSGVHEPVASEFPLLRRNQVLFTYLHLAASRACTQALLAGGTTALAYETVQPVDGT